MNRCSSYGKAANVLNKILDEIKQSDIEDYYSVQVIYVKTIEHLLATGIDSPCLDCDECLTFVEVNRIVQGFLFDGKDRKWVLENDQYVRRARGIDQILRHLDSIDVEPLDYDRKPFISNNKVLVYLDHNIIDKYHKNEEVKEILDSEYADIQYVYSPSHLEEIKRMENEEEQQQVIETIRAITASLFISNYEENKLSLAYEDPSYGMGRVLKSNVAPDVEAYRVITNEDRKIFYPERNNQLYTSRLTFEKVYNHETVVAIYEQFKDLDMLDDKGRVKRYTFVHQAVHKLIQILDNLGYKVDKGRAIKSSAHDIEHMIYAAGTDILVTMDNKFKERSKLIYKRLGITTVVMDWSEYLKYINSLVKTTV